MRKALVVVTLLALLGDACSDSSDESSTASNSSGSSPSTSGSDAEESSGSAPLQLEERTNDEGRQDATSNSSIDVELNDFSFKSTFFKVTDGQALSLHLTNAGQNPHTFTAPAFNIDETLQPGETRDVAVTIGTDTTEFHCRFHQSAGMQGGFFL